MTETAYPSNFGTVTVRRYPAHHPIKVHVSTEGGDRVCVVRRYRDGSEHVECYRNRDGIEMYAGDLVDWRGDIDERGRFAYVYGFGAANV